MCMLKFIFLCIVYLFMTNFKQTVFLYDLLNAPQETTTFNTSMGITGGSVINLGRIQDTQEYELSSNNVESLGYDITSPVNKELFNADLLLAINLNAEKAIISRMKPPIYGQAVRIPGGGFRVPVLNTGPVALGDTLQTRSFTVPLSGIGGTANVAFNASVAVDNGTDSIEETKVIDTLKRLKNSNVHWLAIDMDVKKANVKLAALEYESATSSFSLAVRFKHLFNAFELGTNWEGLDIDGDDFDVHAENEAGVTQAKVKGWRLLYNRLKHPVQTEAHINLLSSGLTDMPNDMIELRSATNAILKKRLISLYPL